MGSIQEGQERSGGIEQGPHRLVVRTSRCGRDNPGSTPGVVILRCMAASQECQCQHTKLGSGARTSRTKLASAHPKNTHFGTDWGAESAQQCPWTAGAHRGPRQQRVKCARYCECVRRPCGLMDKALVFGTKDCRLESCQDQGVGKARGSSVTDAAWADAGAQHAIAARARPRALPGQMGPGDHMQWRDTLSPAT